MCKYFSITQTTKYKTEHQFDDKILYHLKTKMTPQGQLMVSLCSFLNLEIESVSQNLWGKLKKPDFSSWPTRQENVREFLCAWKYEII